ncbi:ABC transporter permease [Clostridium sp. CM028]|uniref:ABC transporter permease n=1 Tax=unclassified Clostridium TaxID=2614128 RepID=UPI001C6F04F3|nr:MULTISPECIES: ABC transporter permease [unclassified Clostridium]MBW9144047.1 ABC transporter permease [Clostridium sp. CM027]MBW9147642.1 ABC transporter permease [Clostridium sp. CM028]UVE41301.1 ABC transporter permease [Clostridium sp. CM027]WLC61972.1 ABC transporter permease [Clostridium sp. CM028]
MKIFRIFIKDIKVFLGNIKFYVLIYLIMPLLLGVLYGMMYEKQLNPDRHIPIVNVALIDMDKSSYTAPLKDILTNDDMKKFVELSQTPDIDEVKANLQKGKLKTAIVIPKGFSEKVEKGETVNIKVLKASSSGVESQIIFDIVNSYVQVLNNNVNIFSAIDGSVNDKTSIDMLKEAVITQTITLNSEKFINTVNITKDKKLSGKQIFTISMLAFISLYLSVIGGQNMVREKEDGTFARLRSTTLSMKNLYVAKICFVFFITLVDITLYMGICKVIGISVGDSYVKLILISILHAFAITGISAFIMNLYKSQKNLNASFTAVIMVFAMLGGSFYPLEYTGEIMRKIAKITPNYWIQDSYNKVVLGGSIKELTVNIIVLLGVGILGIAFGAFFMRKKEGNNLFKTLNKGEKVQI